MPTALSTACSVLSRRLVSLLASGAIAASAVPPSGADSSKFVLAGGSTAISPTDWGFTDADIPADVFSAVKLTTLPSQGTLTVDGVPATAGQTVPVLPLQAGATWVSRQDSVSIPLRTVASSADGMRLVAAGGYYDRIHLSTDGGYSWARAAAGSFNTWTSFACSADGTKWIATPGYGQIQISTDSGVTWTARGIYANWISVASSADGSRFAAASSGGKLYTSSDSGTTWTARDSARAWSSIISSADGSRLAATVDSGQIYTSSDSGVSWTARASTQAWKGIASSADGSKLVATANNSQIYTSTDFGVTWTARGSVAAWRGVCSSADGSRLGAVVSNGQIFTSADFGLSWTARHIARNWNSIASSADGSRLAAAGDSIYTSVGPTPVIAYTAPSGTGSADFTFQVQDSAAANNLDLSAHTLTLTLADLPTIGTATSSSITTSGATLGATVTNDGGAAISERGVVYSLTNINDDPSLGGFGVTKLAAPGTTGAFNTPVTGLSAGTVMSFKAYVKNSLGTVHTSVASFTTTGTAPSGTDKTKPVLVGSATSITKADWGFSDTDSPPHDFSAVKITTLPTVGTLSVDGSPAAAGQTVSVKPSAAGSLWTPHGAPTDWTRVASSADGTKLAALSYSYGPISISSDAGASWTARGPSHSWTSICTSADGSKLAATTSGGLIYSSIDYGVTWTSTWPNTNAHWRAIVSSADGSKLAAVTMGLQIYFSTNYGATWTARGAVRNWTSIACSSDATKLVAVTSSAANIFNPGGIYTSDDAGLTWVDRGVPGSWQEVTSSANGTKLAAVAGSGRIYTSSDSGATWTAREANRQWRSIASSADGSILVAGSNGNLYTSTDSGVTWTARDSEQNWADVACSADGSRMVAGSNYGLFYTSVGATPAISYVAPAGTVSTSFSFQVQDSAAADSVDLSPNTLTLNISTAPVQSAPSSTGVTTTGATLAGVVTAEGGTSIMERGMIYSPTLQNAAPSLGGYAVVKVAAIGTTGALAVPITGLLPGTSYSYRSYALNAVGAGYSAVATFVTPGRPPSGRDRVVSVLAGGSTVIQPADWGFSDSDTPPHDFAAVKLTSLPSTGTLAVNGVAATVGQVVSMQIATTNGAWTPRDFRRDWNAITSSVDGMKLAATVSNGQIYTSADAGTSWTARGPNAEWLAITSSADGKRLVAITSAQLFTSSDSGVTWTVNDLVAGTLTSIASSKDGMKLAVTTGGSWIHTSKDAGLTWTNKAHPASWTSIGSSADGSRLSAGDDLGRLYTSANSGETWALASVQSPFIGLVSSADGSHLAAISQWTGSILTSADYGVTWTLRDDQRVWTAIACSEDGSKLAATAEAGQVYVSADYGATWTANEPKAAWSAITSSADGKRLAAVAFEERIYISTQPAPVITYTVPAGVGSTRFTFQVQDSAAADSLDLSPNTLTLNYAAVPIITSPRSASITRTSASLGGQVTSTGGAAISERGVVYSLTSVNADPSLGGSGVVKLATTGSTGAFALTASGLTPGEDYSFRAYALNSRGVGYSALAHFASRATPPAGADKTLTIGTGSSTILPSSTWGFTDNDAPPHSFSAVKITTLPTHGTLMVDGTPATVDQIVRVKPGPAGADWTFRTGDPSRWWGAVASSADGKRLAAVTWSGPIFTSSDYGATWTERDASRFWVSITSSADGMKLAAVESGGRIYTSTNGGVTWNPRETARSWSAITSSADGNRLAALESLGRVFVSANAGRTWTATGPVRGWTAITSSRDGSKLAAVVYGGFIYTSTDYGVNWEPRESNRSWLSITSSADGVKLAAVEELGQIYTSSDSGVTWEAREGGSGWASICSSADGSKLAATSSTGEVFTSVDSGVTWQSNYLGQHLVAIASSADGSRLVASAYARGLCTSVGNAPLISYTAPAETGSSSFTFQVEDSASSDNLDLSANKLRFDYAGRPVITSATSGSSTGATTATISGSVTADGGSSITQRGVVYSLTSLNPDPSLEGYAVSQQTTTGTSGAFTVPLTSLAPGRSYSYKLYATNDRGTSYSSVATFVTPGTAPTGSDKTLPLLVGEAMPIKLSDWGFLDADSPAHSFTAVKLNSLPTLGTLLVDGAPATAGQVVSLLPGPAGAVWTERSGAPSIANGLASSADGLKLAAFTTHSLHTSTDGGETWQSSSFPVSSIIAIACSADGNQLVLVANNSPIYISNDFGASWVARERERAWFDITSSADGRKLAAVVSKGQIFTSADAGLTWTARAEFREWVSITSSADGTRLAATEQGGRIHVSSDSGATWQPTASVADWNAITSSATGDRLAATVYGGQIYTSSDAGLTWIARESDREWVSITSSADGTRLAAGVYGGQIYHSTDAGITWTPASTNQLWNDIVSSADGTRLAASNSSGPIHTSSGAVPQLSYSTASVGSASIDFLVQDSAEVDQWDLSPNTLTLSGATLPQISSPTSNDITGTAAMLGGTVDADGGLPVMERGVVYSLDSVTPVIGSVGSTKVIASGTTTGPFTVAVSGLTPSTRHNFRAYVTTGVGTTYTGVSSFVSTIALPQGADRAITMNSGQTYTLSLADWGFSDADKPTNGLKAVKIVSLPSNGVLKVGGVEVTAGQTISLMPTGPAGETWTAESASTIRTWNSIASSADGTRIAALDSSGYCLRSFDFGRNWLPTFVSSYSAGIASSEDGSKLVAVFNSGRPYTSSNAGATWVARFASARNWRAVASSADGTKLAAVIYGGQIYTSGNSGQSWTARNTNRNWISITSSADGTKLAACVDGGQIYTSTNSGVTLTGRGITGNWRSITSSANGTKLAAVNYGSGIYVSSDSGVTWVPRQSSCSYGVSITSSSDGSQLLALPNYGSICVSSDSGATWADKGLRDHWRAAAMTSDGRRMVALPSNGPVYTSAGPLPVITYTPPAVGSGRDSFTFQVQDTGPSNANLDPTVNTLTFTHNGPISIPTTITHNLALNRSTGLLEGTVQVTNSSTITIGSLRLTVTNLALTPHKLWNASYPGGNFIDSAQSLSPGATVSIPVKIYSPLRTLATWKPEFYVDGIAATTIDPITSTHAAAGGSYDISVQAASAWPVIESLPWVSVSTEKGTGYGTLTLTIQPNLAGTSRTGTILIGTATHTLTQAGATVPILGTVLDQDTVIGAAYSLTIPVSHRAATFSVSGLPRGLTFDAVTGTIIGNATVPGVSRVTLTARNSVGSSSASFNLRVAPLPASVVGTYQGYFKRDELQHATRLEFTTTASGTLSGKMNLGADTYRFAGKLTVDSQRPSEPSFTTSVTIVDPVDPALTTTFTFKLQFRGIYCDVGFPGEDFSTQVIGQAWRNPWSATNPATALAGVYNFGLLYPGIGSGYGSINASRTGTATVVGQLADGTAYSSASHLGAQGEVLVYQSLYNNQGGIHGVLSVNAVSPDMEDNTISASPLLETKWWKPVIPEDTVFPDGLDVTFTVEGGIYLPPTTGQLVMDLDPALSVNAAVHFLELGPLPQGVRVMATGQVLTVMPNPNLISLSVVPSTGFFSGSFTLPEETGIPLRRTTFSGLIMTTTLGQLGSGHFFVPVPPAEPLPFARWPKFSGVVQLLAP